MKTFQQFMEQVPEMNPGEYNKQIARRQATQKIAQMKHVHQEIGAEARAQERQKRAEMKAIMSR
jgi:50S ribosomal subunit-associated GTPase HflX